jgi:hypothetical protein
MYNHGVYSYEVPVKFLFVDGPRSAYVGNDCWEENSIPARFWYEPIPRVYTIGMNRFYTLEPLEAWHPI